MERRAHYLGVAVSPAGDATRQWSLCHHLHESILQRAVHRAVINAGLAKPTSCTPSGTPSRPTSCKALPFCHVTLRGQKPLPPGYPREIRTLGDRIRKRRMDLGLSQRKLAKLLGVDKKSVENWERRGIAPVRWVTPKINEFVGVQALEKIENLGDVLTAYRRSLAISQERLAILIGVDRCTIARWETGATTPPKRFREKVKTFLEGKSRKPVRSEPE